MKLQTFLILQEDLVVGNTVIAYAEIVYLLQGDNMKSAYFIGEGRKKIKVKNIAIPYEIQIGKVSVNYYEVLIIPSNVNAIVKLGANAGLVKERVALLLSVSESDLMITQQSRDMALINFTRVASTRTNAESQTTQVLNHFNRVKDEVIVYNGEIPNTQFGFLNLFDSE